MVFAISDNGVSISLKDKGWVHQLYSRASMKQFVADGANVLDVHEKSSAAIAYSRSMGRPSLLVISYLLLHVYFKLVLCGSCCL